jgi:enoyl-CoA hydratase/carnithine racemase
MTDHTPDLLAEDVTAGVRTLTLLNGRAHPLSSPMIAAVHAALDRAANDPDTRMLVITAPGHIFCAGHDLKEIARHRADPDQGRAYLAGLFDACAAMMLRLARFPKPTIAMVDGIATAAGLQLMASCDLRFVSDRATFALPGVTNGGFCTTPAVGVSRAIARGAVMDLALSGEPLGAEWALRTGLATRVMAPDVLALATQTFATTLATRNPGPIMAGKAALDAHLNLPLDAAYALATPVMIDHFMDPARLERETQRLY